MKKVQISKELFLNLIRYHIAEAYELEEDIKSELENKLNTMAMRENYIAFKTASTEQEREDARRKYLEQRAAASLRDINRNE